MKPLSVIILSFSSVFVMSACTKDVGADPALLPKVLNCDSITYNTNIKPIIIANCANSGICHVANNSGGAPGDFTNYTDLFAKVQNGTFKNRVIDGNPNFMPYTGRLPEEEIAKIKCWLDAGAPDN